MKEMDKYNKKGKKPWRFSENKIRVLVAGASGFVTCFKIIAIVKTTRHILNYIFVLVFKTNNNYHIKYQLFVFDNSPIKWVIS